jgi:glutamyl-tRNA synthetase
MSAPCAKSPPVGRLAPSPTGKLHLGHARTFALAWAHVRSRGGRVLLRLDDLDATRCRPEHEARVLADLEWLGLDWDGPVLRQSDGVERLRRAAEGLLSSGAAYACVCSRADLQAAVAAPHRGDRELRYPGTCRGRFAGVAAARARSTAVALRLAVPAEPVVFVDGIAGPRSEDVAATVGDFVLLNRQSAPSYQLATAVDDADQSVTEVFRGDDLLASTARQISILRALGLPEPLWYHVPLVVDEAGRRLAKRRDDLGLSTLRERGVDPRAVIGWVARSAGLTLPERASACDLARAFEVSRIPKATVRLSPRDVMEV